MSLLGVIRSVVLARLLTPDIFGMMALALIVVRAIETFTRPGVAQALIARTQSFEEASGTAFTLLVWRGVLLAACLAIAAPFVADFYDSPQLSPMLMVLGGVFVLGGFRNINTIARQKELEFRQLTYLAQSANVAGTIVTIALAWWLRSVWALVAGQLVTAALNAGLSYWFVPGRVRFTFDRVVARDLLSYGKFVTASSVLLFIATEIDSAVIGKVLGTESLGYYTVAFTIVHLSTTQLAKVASSIMMPAYSKLQSDRGALRGAYLRTLTLVMFAVLPASVGIILLAEPIIRVVYGEKWLPAVVPLQILATFGLFRSLAAISGYLFEGIGKPKASMIMGACRLAFIVPLIVPLAAKFGLAGAATVVTAGMAVQWLVGLVMLYRELGVGLGTTLKAMGRPSWSAAVMGAVAWGLTFLVDVGSLWGLLLTVCTAAAVYMLLNLTFLIALKNERWS